MDTRPRRTSRRRTTTLVRFSRCRARLVGLADVCERRRPLPPPPPPPGGRTDRQSSDRNPLCFRSAARRPDISRGAANLRAAAAAAAASGCGRRRRSAALVRPVLGQAEGGAGDYSAGRPGRQCARVAQAAANVTARLPMRRPLPARAAEPTRPATATNQFDGRRRISRAGERGGNNWVAG